MWKSIMTFIEKILDFFYRRDAVVAQKTKVINLEDANKILQEENKIDTYVKPGSSSDAKDNVLKRLDEENA